MRLRSEGIHTPEGLIPRKVNVRAVGADEFGQSVVRLCEKCYTVHSIRARGSCRNCGASDLRAVHFDSEAIIERRVNFLKEPTQISETFYFCEDIEGQTKVHGAVVEYQRMTFQNDHYFALSPQKERFEARYYRSETDPEPVMYRIRTRGIEWKLDNVVSSLLKDTALQQRVESYGKVWNAELILHTAAHMLYKAIAALSGVKDQVLEYAVQQDRMSIAVWERYEGGVGISEIVQAVIKENPKALYRELASSFLCPVYYAETDPDDSETLTDKLAAQLSLQTDEDREFLFDIAGEAEAEQARSAELHEPTCSKRDGCPACIQVVVCTEYQDQWKAVSRCVAEAILRFFLQQRVDWAQLNGINAYRLDQVGVDQVCELVFYSAEDGLDLYDVLRW